MLWSRTYFGGLERQWVFCNLKRVDRGYGEHNEDFLESTDLEADNVITNPPFKYAKEFIEKSLEVTSGKVAMFCKIQLLEGVARREMFEKTPLKTDYDFSKDKTN